MEEKMLALTGNEAAAYAMLQINPDVVAAYPITPQTELMHKFSEFVADGKVDTELILVESEHSAMSAVIGASAAGCRSMTATSANGLALMWEMVYIASGNRLPVTMAVVNRALSAPINIHCDHSDSMGARDAGWIQLFSENSQEVYDNVLQAVRIAETQDVLLPAMATLDGFVVSHSIERVDMVEDEAVRDFIGTYTPEYPLLNTESPVTYGPLDLQDYYFEHKRQQVEAMKYAKDAILKVGEEFAELSGRKYGLFEPYRMDDAEIAAVVLGSTAGTTKAVVDNLRDEGMKAGLLKLRAFRPFPHEELADALGNMKAVAVMDRSDSFGALGGPVFAELRSAFYGKADVPIVNYIYGLGGRDVPATDVEKVYRDLDNIAKSGEVGELVSYLGVRE
jgi:pyruvate ferredoxin oxidoreductase alpha subunit